MKTILGTLAGLVLVAALAGYFIFVPHFEQQYADQVAQGIDGLPGELKAESIRVQLLAGTVEILGLKGPTTYIDGSDMFVDVERIAISDLRFSAFAKPGATKVADSVEVVNGTVMVRSLVEGLEEGVTQNITFSRVQLDDVRGDVHALLLLRESRAPGSQIMGCLTGFSIGHARCEGYSNVTSSVFGPMSITVERFSSKNVSLLSTGEGSWENVRFSAFGSELLDIGRVGLEHCAVPNFYVLLFEALETGSEEDLGAKLFALMEKDPFVFEGLTLEDSSFVFLQPEPLTAKKIRIDAHIAADGLRLRKKAERLSVPTGMYRNLSLEAAQFADYYGKPLLLDGSLDLDITHKDGKGDIHLKEYTLSDPALVFVSLALDLPYQSDGLDALLDQGADLYLRKGSAVLEDKGFLANLFAGEFEAIKAFGMEGEGMNSPEELRGQVALAVRGQVEETDNADLKRVLEGLVRLLEAPGKLTVTLNPDQPVLLDLESDSLPPLHATVEYNAAD